MVFARKSILVLFFICAFFALHLVPAKAATFELNPSSKTFEKQCQRSIDIIINATGESSNAAEIEISFDPTQIQIIDSNASIPGIQIKNGNAYESYFYNEVDQNAGKIKVAAASLFLGTLTTSEVFATIEFNSTASATTANFTITFLGVGNTLDSNIADAATNNDLLTSVTNGTYTFVNSPCTADTQPPQVIFVYPTNGATNVPLDSTVQIQLTDDQSGINLSTLEIIINGELYMTGQPEVLVSGSDLNYTLTISPRVQFPANQASIVNVKAQDNTGNQIVRQIIFNSPQNVPTNDNESPIVVFIDPQNQDNNVPANAQVSIQVTDNLSGIDLNTVSIFLNGQEFKVGNAALSYSGSPTNYLFTLNQNGIIRPSEFNFLRIVGSDVDGNQFDRQIVFNVPNPVVCPEPKPDGNGTTGGGGDTGGTTDDVPVTTGGGPITEEEIKKCFGETVDTQEFTTVVQNYLSADSGAKPLQNTIFQNTVVETVVNTVVENAGLGGLIALLASVLFGLNILRFISLITTPTLLFTLIGFVFGRKAKDPWGVVTDALTNQPVAFAACRIFLKDTQYPVSQTITDLDGRYGFILQAGNYRLEIKQSGYLTHVQELNIKENDKLAMDVKLKPVGASVEVKVSQTSKFKEVLSKLYLEITHYVFVFGSIISIIAFIFAQTPLNLLIIGLYVGMGVLNAFPRLLKRGKKYASVINSENKLRMPFVQIKLYDAKTYQVIDTVTTNYNGQFDFYGKEGTFAVLVVAPGYRFPSTLNTYPIAEGSYQSMVLLNVKKGKNDFNIYIDPVNGAESKNKPDIYSNMASPFAD